MINLLLLLVYLLIWLFFQLESPGTTWNQLESPGISWNLIGLGSSGTDWKFTSDWNPDGKFGGCSLLFGRYPTQKIPVGIHLVLTGSGQNLWSTVKTSADSGNHFDLPEAS